MWTAFQCLALATLCGTSVAVQDAVNGVIPGPPTFYQWVLPLDYDGVSFTVPKAYASCGMPWDARPYVASKDGPLTLTAPVALEPICASSGDAFYIVARPVSWTDGKPDGRHFDAKSSFPAIAVAGPVEPGAHSWLFKPLQPELKMRAGYGYMFFVAQLVAL